MFKFKDLHVLSTFSCLTVTKASEIFVDFKKLANVDSKAVWYFHNNKGTAVISSRVTFYVNECKTFLFNCSRGNVFCTNFVQS